MIPEYGPERGTREIVGTRPARVRGPAEDSGVLAFEELEKRQKTLEAKLAAVESKAAETSAQLIRLPKKDLIWRVVAILLGAFGIGGTGTSGYVAWNLNRDRDARMVQDALDKRDAEDRNRKLDALLAAERVTPEQLDTHTKVEAAERVRLDAAIALLGAKVEILLARPARR